MKKSRLKIGLNKIQRKIFLKFINAMSIENRIELYQETFKNMPSRDNVKPDLIKTLIKTISKKNRIDLYTAIFNNITMYENEKPDFIILGQLDYPKNKISMYVESYWQYFRLFSAQKEPETVLWIEEKMQPGDVFYDIGANVGAYSYIAYSVTGGNCWIYAFEPSFSTFEILNRNCFLNNMQDRIIPFQILLSDKTGLENFSYSDLTAGSALHVTGNDSDLSSKAEEIKLRQKLISYKLDDFITQFKLLPPSLIKLDVDGAELIVIHGADEILSASTLKSLLIEIDESSPTFEEIVHIMTRKGFRLENKYKRGTKDTSTIFNYIWVR